jgi:hypothetical protein
MANRFVFTLMALTLVSRAALAQQPQDHAAPVQPPPAGQHQHATPRPQDEHAQHAAGSLFLAREGSGTSWLPEATPMYALHGRAGTWELMWHGNAYLQFLHEEAEVHRGASQAGSINWLMGMARRPAGAGRLGLRAMVSLEPATLSGCGYPDLLATGELCDGDSIHDRQHPHDFFMELAFEYERPLASALRWQLYAGLAGEPALGPGAYPHRSSAMVNLLAPIGHHWLDATHITYGVMTAGIFSGRWKAEASVFNGREPDENRWDLDLDRLDSFSGRLWFAPTPALAMQVSAGHLNEAEEPVGGVGPRADVDRVTASLTYQHQLAANRYLASTLGWGRNEEHGEATHSLVLETNLSLGDRDTWFGRAEISGKPAHDLHVHDRDGVFTVAKLQAGYTRYVTPVGGVAPGFGGTLSLSIVPPYLEPRYGNRVNPGFGVYITLRPAAHRPAM